jgi:preprotein translocase subunit SecA
LVEYLQRDDELDDFFNAMAIFMLIDIVEDKYIDLIREVFKTKPVDIYYDGDFEDIEISLGLREQRSKQREKNEIQKMLEDFEMEDRIQPLISTSSKIGRNDPCPCGSGKKYKKCCLNK